MPKVVITSGGTREYIDDVRFISNVSTGALGAEIAEIFANNNWQTTLIHGCGAILPSNSDIKFLPIISAIDAKKVLIDYISDNNVDVIIHLMAVADYAPVIESGKISSTNDELIIKCLPTPKILPEIKKVSPQSKLISFKLEQDISWDELRKRGIKSMTSAGCDYVVINLLSGIDGENHPAEILNSDGEVVKKMQNKTEIAKSLVELV